MIMIFYSCNSKKNYDNFIVKTNNIQVSYSNLEVGDSITIIFNKKDIIKSNDDKISMIVHVYLEEGNLSYPIRIYFTDIDDDHCVGTISIQENSIFLRLFIYQNDRKLMEYAAFPVFIDDKPKHGSLFFLMEMSRDLAQFERLYNIDKEINKYNYSREIPNVKAMIKGGTEIYEIKKYLQNIESEFESEKKEINETEKQIYFSSLAFIYTQLEDFKKTNYFLSELTKFYQTEKSQINLIVKSNVINVFNLIMNFIKQDKYKLSALESLIDKIIIISNSNQSCDYLRGILLPCDSTYIANNKTKLSQIFNNALTSIRKLTPNKLKLIADYPDYFWILSEKFQFADLAEFSEESLQKGIEIFEYSKENKKSDNGYIYDINFDNGILSAMQLKYADIKLLEGDTTNAMILYKKIIETSYANFYNRGPITFAAHRMAEIKISKNEFNESRKYLYTSYTLGDPRLKLLINKYEKQYGYLEDELLNSIKVSKQSAKNLKPNFIKKIETDRGSISLNEYNNKYYILIFLNDECIACNLKLDNFINDILKNYDSVSLFFISNRMKNTTANYNSTSSIYYSTDTDLKKNFKNINLFPFMVIIKNCKIIWELNAFPSTFIELLSN